MCLILDMRIRERRKLSLHCHCAEHVSQFHMWPTDGGTPPWITEL